MITTITKSYDEQHYKHFSVYGRPSFRSTNVFWEYFDLLVFNSAEKEITEVIKNHKKKSKSKINISYSKDGVNFFKPNKHVFPEFYIILKDEK